MPTTLTYEFCTIDIYNNYLIVVMNSGVHITPDHNEVLENIVDSYFRDRPFVYLTHRKHSYSVDPAIYKKTSQIANLAGFGVIAEFPVSRANAEIERLFLNKPFEIFDDLESAKQWAANILKDEKQRS